MHEFFGIAAGLILLALANELGGPDPVLKTDVAPRPVMIVSGR